MLTRSSPAERERTRSLLPGAQLITLKNTGHFSAIESPSELFGCGVALRGGE
jgi:hypothetical protein